MVDYDLLCRQVRQLADEDRWFLPLMANVSALLYETLPDLNWAGFYLMRNGQLVLGPFQGKPACIHIMPGKGVCGTALKEDRTQRVDDVHLFPGHIACDSASNSEIVVPLHRKGQAAAVLDLDSPSLCRFTARDQEGLEKIGRVLDEVIQYESSD